MEAFREVLVDLVKARRAESKPFWVMASPGKEPIEITFAILDNAVNRASRFLAERLPKDVERFVWMSKSDIRYLVWLLAAIKVGKTAIFPSLSNKTLANLRLFETIGVNTMFYGPESAESLQGLITTADSAINASRGFSFDELMSPEPVLEFAFNAKYDEIRDRPFVALHTSGTSGHPKPIFWGTGTCEVLFSHFLDLYPKDAAPEVSMAAVFDGQRVLAPGPLSHSGTLLTTMWALKTNTTVVAPHPDVTQSPTNIKSLLDENNVSGMVTSPVLIENLMDLPEGLLSLSRLSYVAYIGGPINPTRGKTLSKVLPRLFCWFGATEGGTYHLDVERSSDNWDALRLVQLGQKMEEVSPGIYELVFPRTEQIMKFYAFFESYPHLTDEYRSKDLFSPVPGREGWWKYRGRTDNWITMTNGLKMDPTSIETTVMSHPEVAGALVAGSHRFRLCLLVELKNPPSTNKEERDALERIWPKIQEANQGSPRFGVIPRELVIISSGTNPFLRAAKGTIQRQLTVQAFEDEIERLYQDAEDGLRVADLLPIPGIGRYQLEPWLLNLYKQSLDGSDLGLDDDVFSRGLDSFGVSVITMRLKASIRGLGVQEEKINAVTLGFIYSATTVRNLASRLASLLENSRAYNEESQHFPIEVSKPKASKLCISGIENKQSAIVSLLMKTLPRVVNQRAQSIILTGSTGSLGTYLLSAMLSRPGTEIKKVFCLNRSADAALKQIKSLESRGLATHSLDRAIFLTTDFAAPALGLSTEDYENLLQEATGIIHNAWPVNFLMPLNAFEPHIQGFINLLQLAVSCQRRPSFCFVSSISTALGGTGTIHETIHDKPETLLAQGYAQAKYICERLLDAWAQATSMPAAVLRVGQVAGPIHSAGVWNPSEWLPSIIRSSKYLGALPEDLGSNNVINWIPVDELSEIVLELLYDINASTYLPSREPGAAVFNIVNPRSVTWQDLLPALYASLGTEKMDMMPFASWVDRLEDSIRRSRNMSSEENPAVRLLSFYREVETYDDEAGRQFGRPFEVNKLLAASETAQALRPINGEWMRQWVAGWKI